MTSESIIVRALGPLEVGRGTGTAALGGPRQRAVLAMLIARARQVVTMEQLIDGVWGDDPPSSARKTVQGYLAVLRREVERHGARIESAASSGYRLANDRSEIDSTRFEDLLTEAAPLRATEPARVLELLREASELWRGDAFGDLADTPGIAAYAIRLDELRLAAIEQRLDLETDVGNLDHAVADLEQFTRQHPWREQPWLSLMTAQFQQGRQAEALRTYERMREQWADAGLSPTPALRELSDRIVMDEVPRLERSTRSSVPTAVDPDVLPKPWPMPPTLRRLADSTDRFVGRRAERKRGEEAIEAAFAGERQVLFVAGEPGAGKTRLCAELARYAIDRNDPDAGNDTDTNSAAIDNINVNAACAVVLFGGSEEGLGLPFQPLGEALEQIADAVSSDAVLRFAEPHQAALGLLSDRFGDAPVGNDLDAQRFRLFSAATEIVRRLTDERPLLWIVDDAQWTSRSMCQLLSHVFRALPGARLVVAITYRDSDVGLDHPVTTLLADCRRLTGVHEVLLSGLDEADVAELVGDSLIGTVMARAGGNPFFVTELARHMRDGVAGDAPAVDDVVIRRVNRLAEPVVAALRLAAVCGLRFPVRVIARALGDELLDVADRLDEAVGARLVEPVPGSELSYAFRHALVRDALVGSMRTSQRLRAHVALAGAYRDLYPDATVVASELAYHWCEAAPAGHLADAVAACRAAARVARGALGLDEAIAHLERALALVAADPSSPARDRAELLVDLARANWDAGRSTALLDRAFEASAVAEAAGLDDLVVASALVIRGGMTLTAVAGSRRAAALLAAGLARTSPGSDEHLMLRAKRTSTTFFMVDVDTLASIADDLLDGAQASGRPDVIRAVTEDVAWFARREQHHRCVELLRSSVDAADPFTELPYLTQAMDEAYGSGDGATFRDLFATFVPRAAGNLSYSLTGAFGLATLSLFDGDIDRAMHEARLARRLGLAERRVSVVTAYTAFALHVAWLRGRLANMRRLADWSWADQPHPQNEALRAWVYAVGGDAAPLRSFVANFTDVHRLMLVSARFTSGSLGALTHAAVLTNDGDALALGNELWADITEVVHGGFYPPDVAVAHYRGLLARAADELDQSAAWFRQAVVDHESLGSRPHAAVSRTELAATLTRRGRAADRDEIASLVATVAGEVRTVATAPA